MNVVIFCGGIGARLKEETEFKPKPLVKIGSKPILWHIMKTYAHYGHTDFILCLGYKGEQIKEYFYNYELMSGDFTLKLGERNNPTFNSNIPERGWNITLADTGDDALKGARLKRVEKYVVGDTFMVTYGDGVAYININNLLAFHRSHGKMATVTGVNPLSRFGELSVAGERVTSFSEKPAASGNWVNGGFFVFNRAIFECLEDKSDCDLEYSCLERIAAEGELMVYKNDKFWACMDTIRDMEYLNKLWAENKAEWKTWE